MFERIKNMILSPKKEWGVIGDENASHGKLFMKYVLPLSLISTVAVFIGYGLIGVSFFGVHFHSVEWGIRQAIVQWVSLVGGIYVAAIVINLLAEKFQATKDFDKAFAVVAYSYIPALLGGIFYILPSLSVLALIPAIYSLYLLYTGLQPLMKVPAEKNTVYFIVSLLVLIVVAVVFSAVLNAIFVKSFMSNIYTTPAFY